MSCSESAVLQVCGASQSGSAPSPVQLEISWEALCMLLSCTSVKCPHAFQSYVPVMEAGSDVTFRWTVDDKPSFTFYNVVFNVIYQSPAVYKLSVSQGLSRDTISILGFHLIPQTKQEKQQGEEQAELSCGGVLCAPNELCCCFSLSCSCKCKQ